MPSLSAYPFDFIFLFQNKKINEKKFRSEKITYDNTLQMAATTSAVVEEEEERLCKRNEREKKTTSTLPTTEICKICKILICIGIHMYTFCYKCFFLYKMEM